MSKSEQKQSSTSWPSLMKLYPWVLLVASTIGLGAAFVLTLEKFAILKDPNHELSCSLNPLLSCGPIIGSDQASAFGFPNPVIGLIGFSVLITVAVSMLSGGLDPKKLPNWYKRTFAASVTFGFGFCLWLMYQSFYNLDALCIYCMVVWSVVSAIFYYSWLWLASMMKLTGRAKQVYLYVRRNHLGILIVWYLTVMATIFFAFRDYFETLY